MKRLALTFACALTLSFALTSLAAAEDTPAADNTPTYRIDPRIELPVLAIELTVAFGWTLGPQLSPAHCAPMCDRKDVWAIDRFSAGWYDRTWIQAANIGIAAQLVLAGVTLVVDEGWQAALIDALVVAEAIAGAQALSVISNTSTRRPRPHLYGTESPESERRSGTASLSFFSGHTAGAFAAAISVFETLRRRHPGRASNYLVLGVGLLGGIFIGTARVLGGQHFLTDVAAGAIVGTSMGFLVPALHSVSLGVQPSRDGLALSFATALDL